MKFLAIIGLAIASAVAAPPSGPIFIARVSQAPQQAPVVPYPVAGNRQQAYVLARQEVPQTVYNPPQATTTETVERNSTIEDSSERNSTTEDSIETSTEPQSEQIQSEKKDQKNQKDKLVEGANAVPLEQGEYYLYHPTGVLQRVAYATSNDAANMAYIAQLKYQNVDPIRGPVYTYDPDTFFLQQVRV